MRIITVGDIHGRDYWKYIDPKEWDHIVFIGDYCDGYSNDYEIRKKEIENFKEIIQFKKDNLYKVILLLGNHDIHYVYYPKYICSRFNSVIQPELTQLFSNNRDLFQFAFEIGNHLWSHAGISNTWANKYISDVINDENNKTSLANYIDFALRDKEFLHSIGRIRGGRDIGGITWADAEETCRDFLNNFHQIVGHSRVKGIRRLENKEKQSSITYTDCFDTKVEFHKLEL